MLDLASASAGGRVVMVSSIDAEHPGENVIDGDAGSYWISTGLYPQEILLELGRRARVARVELSSTSVKQIRIEGSQEDVPVNFHMLAEGVLRDTYGQLQVEQLPCEEPHGARTGYVRVVILSGWHDFCSVQAIKVEAPPSETEAKSPKASDSPVIGRADTSRPTTSQFKIRSPGGSVHSVPADPSWTLGELKSSAQAATGIPCNEQRFLVGATELSDSTRVATAAADAENDGWVLSVARRDSRHAHWLEQVRRDGLSLRFAPELADDREVVIAAVRQAGDALQFVAESLRSDREVALAAVRRKGTSLRWAPEALKGSREVALAAVGQNGNALQFCSRALRADREVVLAAVVKHGSALRFACRQLRADPEVVEVAGRTFFFTKQELADFAEDDDDEEDEDEDEEEEESAG